MTITINKVTELLFALVDLSDNIVEILELVRNLIT
jgi:hypothetical protein